MKVQRSITLIGLMFGLLLAPVVAQAQTVHAWEGSITIPTYKLGPADPNPPFPLVRPAPVYPYTMLDNLTNDRVMQKYHAIYLENEYLKITVLPELGGHHRGKPQLHREPRHGAGWASPSSGGSWPRCPRG